MTRIRALTTLSVAPAVLLIGLGAAATTLKPAPLLINESPSLPRGVYRHRPSAAPDLSALVALRQPDAVQPYLARRGMPEAVRLIKRVAATGGDVVCSDGRRLGVPGRVVAVRPRDRAGQPLPVWRGCRRLAADERLLLGDTATSLDSRYFGPVTTAQIEGVYTAVLTW
jgi:type IV secretory pathway protease TraF